MRSNLIQLACAAMGILWFCADSNSPIWAVWSVGSLVIAALRRGEQA